MARFRNPKRHCLRLGRRREREGRPGWSPYKLGWRAQVTSVSWNGDGTQFVTGDSGYPPSFILDASGKPEQPPTLNRNYCEVAWNPRGDQIAAGGEYSVVRVLDGETYLPVWSGVFLPNRQIATFTADGRTIHATPLGQKALAYIVERQPGQREILTYREFHKEFPSLAQADDRD